MKNEDKIVISYNTLRCDDGICLMLIFDDKTWDYSDFVISNIGEDPVTLESDVEYFLYISNGNTPKKIKEALVNAEFNVIERNIE